MRKRKPPNQTVSTETGAVHAYRATYDWDTTEFEPWRLLYDGGPKIPSDPAPPPVFDDPFYTDVGPAGGTVELQWIDRNNSSQNANLLDGFEIATRQNQSPAYPEAAIHYLSWRGGIGIADWYGCFRWANPNDTYSVNMNYLSG